MNSIKIRSGIVILMMVIFVAAAFMVQGRVSAEDKGLTHNLDTIYGDPECLDGLKAELTYETADTTLWTSELRFEAGEVKESTDVRPLTSDDKSKAHYDLEKSVSYASEEDMLAAWVGEHFEKYCQAVRIGDTGYFYITEDSNEPVTIPGVMYNGDGTRAYTDGTHKYELPEGNGIYKVEYKTSESASYIIKPDHETLKLAMELDSDCTIKSIGPSEDGKYLEVFFTEGESLRMSTLSVESDEVTSTIEILSCENPGEGFFAYYPKDKLIEGEGNLTLTALKDGFCLIENKDGELRKVLERKFDDRDGKESLEGLLYNTEFRRSKCCYDGNRFVILSRIVKSDSLYKDHKGTVALVYDKNNLIYEGVITSSIYEMDKDKLRDFYALEYYGYQYDDGWVEDLDPADDPDYSEDSMMDETEEDAEQWYYTGHNWGMYDIVGISADSI